MVKVQLLVAINSFDGKSLLYRHTPRWDVWGSYPSGAWYPTRKVLDWPEVQWCMFNVVGDLVPTFPQIVEYCGILLRAAAAASSCSSSSIIIIIIIVSYIVVFALCDECGINYYQPRLGAGLSSTQSISHFCFPSSSPPSLSYRPRL